jgi:cytochrome c553
MSKLDRREVSVFLIALTMFMTGCAASHAENHHQQQQVSKQLSGLSGNHESTTAAPPWQPTTVAPDGEADRRSIERGNILFNGKALCFECHGRNGEIHTASPVQVAALDLPPPDLRRPTNKSVRQFYLILKYGIPATGMRPLEGTVKLRDEDMFDLIAYVVSLNGSPHSLAEISTQSLRPDTETDVEIAVMCAHEARAEYDTEEHCDDRYAKRYRELIIGRPPDIAIDRYAEIERDCKHRAAGDLDTLALCYRAEYSASRPAPRKHR